MSMMENQILPLFDCVRLTGRTGVPGHSAATHEALGRRMARHLGLRFAGDATGPDSPTDYLIPRGELFGADQRPASALHFLGGWTANGLHATKAVMHPLIDNPAAMPLDWPEALAPELPGLVLPGFTVFSAADARRAAETLFRGFPQLRLKQVHGVGGQGQQVVCDMRELDATLDAWGDTIDRGLVLEENLSSVRTFSVGQVEVPGQRLVYVGLQSMTRNNRMQPAYGGSRLLVLRGGFAALAHAALPAPFRLAIARATAFDRLADRHLGLLASRRNYDVALGRGGTGVSRVAVLEQSWRIGGATPAEMLALEAFAAAPEVRMVRAETVERFGPGAEAPAGAFVLYHGDDPELGPMLKYAILGEGRAHGFD